MGPRSLSLVLLAELEDGFLRFWRPLWCGFGGAPTTDQGPLPFWTTAGRTTSPGDRDTADLTTPPSEPSLPKNRLLDGERPIDMLADERFDEVRRAAEAFVDGTSV